MSWVFKESKAKLGARCVLLALADYAHDDGSRAFPSIEVLSKKARLGERQTQRVLRDLERGGAIEFTGTTGAGTKIWKVLMTPEAALLARASSHHADGSNGLGDISGRSVAEMSPRQIVTPKVNGKPVKSEAWELAVAVLAEFNAQTGKSLKPLTGAGKPSENAKRIYLRVIEHPGITPAQHADIIRRTLASKWWGEGQPSVGVVYGPKVFEDNIDREPSSKQTKADDKEARRARRRAARDRLTSDQKEGDDG